MKVYVIRDNNRDYDCDDLKVFLTKKEADNECRSMIMEDLVDAIRKNEKHKRFFDIVDEVKKTGYDEMAAMDYAVCDVLGGRCFVTEVEVQE